MNGKDYISLNSLNLDELVGVVNLYPWYASARKELCVRMARKGGENWGESQFSDAALYIVSREIISDIVRSSKSQDLSDKDVDMLLSHKRDVRVVGGDYFSQSQYDRVRKADDAVFSRFAAKTKSEAENGEDGQRETEFCSEALAEIYAEQGYYEQASKIYSKLILRYPEKSAYFATLAEKMIKEINN